MELADSSFQPQLSSDTIHGGHFGAVLLTAILLLGISWMKNPELFTLHKAANLAASDSSVPRYYAYVTPPEDLPQPMVAGANTNQGPSIITDDGQVVPIDMGQVLGASTQDVTLSLDDIKVNVVPDSGAEREKYFSEAQKIESNSIGDANFGAALNSGDQAQINQQAQKFIAMRDSMQKLPVPESLVKLHKLKIVQYDSSIALLQNFTLADQNPELVTNAMQQFLKSQQDLDAENSAMAQKYPQEFPNADLYTTSSQGADVLNNNNAIQ